MFKLFRTGNNGETERVVRNTYVISPYIGGTAINLFNIGLHIAQPVPDTEGLPLEQLVQIAGMTEVLQISEEQTTDGE